MSETDLRVRDYLAERGRRLLLRSEALALGVTPREIHCRLGITWSVAHPALYVVGLGELSPDERLLAATLAGGPTAQVSHCAAIRLWGLDGLHITPLDVSVAHGVRARLEGVRTHTSRRQEPTCWVRGIPVTSVERTLLESARFVPPVVTEKAFASAWRLRLTSPEKADAYLAEHAGKGRAGAVQLRTVVQQYLGDRRGPGSVAEVDLHRLLRPALAAYGIEEPIPQFEVALPDGSVAVVDAGFPLRRKAIEVAGLRWHGDIRSHDYDTYREGQIRDAGYDLRVVTPRALRERPNETIRNLIRFLVASGYRTGT